MLTKIAIVADSHYCQDSRFEECVRVHNWIAEDIAQRGVDLLLHSGDMYERTSTPEERRAVASWAQKATATCPLVIVKGNHDKLGDLPLLEKLHTIHPIRVVEDARVIEIGGAVVGCLAWPNKARILALAGAVSHEASEQTAREALRDVLRGLGADMNEASLSLNEPPRHIRPRILLAHAMVCGSTTSVGQPLVGCDLEVAIEDLALAGADFYALGHIHMGQTWEMNNGAPVVYPGSPRRTTFGEVESKGYVLATFDGAELVSWERIETPCARMHLIEDSWDRYYQEDATLAEVRSWQEIESHIASSDVPGSEIRFRYKVGAEYREEARASAEALREAWLSLGAVAVKLDEQVLAQGSARAPEVATATTLDAKLHAYWAARGTTPDAARAERLVSMAQALESEAVYV